MLFYFHFLYSFPFNVISVATVLCFCGFHPPVVSTLPWFPPSHGFHPHVVSTLPWFPPSRGYSVVSTFPWFPPCVVTPWFAPSCHLHLCVVPTLPWLLRGVPSVVCTFMVDSLPWFPPSHGLHLCVVPTLPVVTPWCPFRGLHFRGLHSAEVSTLPWFASWHGFHPPCGYSMVSLSWFALCRGFHPPVVCIFTWFPPSLWLLRGVPSVVCTFMVYTLPWFPPSRGLHLRVVPTLPVVTP